MKTLAVLALLSTADILVWSHRQKRQDGELGLSKEGFPASKQVADGVYSFSNDGFYMSMFVVTSEGVMVVDPMNRNQATVGQCREGQTWVNVSLSRQCWRR